MVDSRYYTIQEASKTLDMHEDNILAAIHSGELVAVNVAKDPNGKRPRWRISESDLGKFLLARRNPASTQSAPVSRSRRPKPKQYV